MQLLKKSFLKKCFFFLKNTSFQGNLPKEDAVWNCDSKITPQDIKIDKKMDCLTGTPEYTNYTASSQKDGFVGCLDYIWGVGKHLDFFWKLPKKLLKKLKKISGIFRNSNFLKLKNK